FAPALPDAMANILREAKTETNSVIAWFDDCEVRGTENTSTPKDYVYRDYQSWCERNGLRALTAPLFWTRLRDICALKDERRRANGRQIRMCNIEWAAEASTTP